MNDGTQENAGVAAPPPLIFAGPLVLGLLLHRVRPLRALPPPLARLIGRPLLVVGIAANAWFIITMRRADTPIDPRQPVRRIVTTGPLRFSRNPSYTSMALIYSGIAAVSNTLWPFLLLPAVLAAMQRGVIEREERYLERTFGQEYTSYKARVRRWL